MNTISKRLAWKETALLRPICISCLALLAMILVAGFVTINNSKDFTEFVGSLVMGIGCVTGLACGILIFVFEREAGTDTFLECFPVDGKQVSRTKLAKTALYFTLYTIGGLLLGYAALAIYDGGAPSLAGKTMPFAWLSMIVLVPVQCLLWSIVCSLVSRSGLYATIASATLTVASVIGLGIITTGWVAPGLSDQNEMLSLAAVYFGMSLILCGAIWYLSPAWLRGKKRTVRSPGLASISKQKTASAKNSYPYRSLVWQNLRRCWIPWLAAGIGLIVTCGIAGDIINSAFAYRRQHFDRLFSGIIFSQMFFVVAGAGIGTLMYSGDQSKSNYLFFQQQADYPRKVWFARLLILLSFIPFVAIAALMSSMSSASILSDSTQHWPMYTDKEYWWLFMTPHALNSIILFITAAGLAQLATMFFRLGSGFVAFIVTIILCVFLYHWFREVTFAGESTIVFLGPLAISCFAATWWFAPRWISDRGRITGAVASFSVCSMVAMSIFGGWIWHRSNEFSVPPQSQEWTAFMAPNSLLANKEKFPTAVKLTAAIKDLQHFEDDSVSFPTQLSAGQLKNHYTNNAKVFEEISICLKDPDCGLFLNPRSTVERSSQKSQLQSELNAATLHHIESGNAEQALDSLEDELRAAWWVAANTNDCRSVLSRFWDWSAQTATEESLIRDAVERIDRLEDEIFDIDSDILYRESVFQIEREVGSEREISHRTEDFSWELERSRRWNLVQLSENNAWSQLCTTPVRRTYIHTSGQFHFDSPDMRTEYFNNLLQPNNAPYLARLRNQLRYTKVRLALSGWKLKHESYPETLRELCEGDQPWLDTMPVSFFSGLEFVYSGKGLNSRVFFTPEAAPQSSARNINWVIKSEFEADIQTTDNWIEPEQPFLLPWSGVIGQKRPFIRVVQNEDDLYEVAEINEPEFGYWIPVGRAMRYETMENPEQHLLK